MMKAIDLEKWYLRMWKELVEDIKVFFSENGNGAKRMEKR